MAQDPDDKICDGCGLPGCICTCNYCRKCERKEHDCICCDGCNELPDDCTCECCDECGEKLDECTCES